MFRNREIQQFAKWFILIAAITMILGLSINLQAGILVIGSAVAFGVLFFVFTRKRYKKIAQLSEQIDLVLHNAEHLYIDDSEEGELSILQSEITKMTLRIREQNDALKKEKERLADSMADIAHQLRTPLTSVNLILSLLEENPSEEERRGLIRETKQLFVQMDWLLTSLLKLSRLDAGIAVFQKEQVEVSSLIRTAIRPLLIPMELHNIIISQSDVPIGIMIRGDASWLSEALQNILKNCMENMDEGGRIEIACKDTPLYTELSIHDSGTGFEKEDFPCLFNRFYRGKNAGATGYGIGLALTKMIITKQGGTITAKNHREGGAVFSIRFPK